MKNYREMTKVNTIEYDDKSYQVKKNIVNFTDVYLKDLKTNLSQKICWYGRHVCDATI